MSEQTTRNRLLLAISEVHSGDREEGEMIVDIVMPEIERLQAALRSICRWPVLYGDGQLGAAEALRQVAIDATTALDERHG